MSQLPDFNFAFIFIIGVLGLIVGSILYFVNKNQTFTARLLSGFLFCTSILCLNFNLTSTAFFLNYPHIWRAIGWASFSIPVFSYLYVRTVLEQKLRLKKTDYLLFLPALLYTLSMLPFYLLPVGEKRQVVANFMNDKSLIAREPEGILPTGWAIMIRLIFGLVLCLCQFYLLFKSKNRALKSPEAPAQNREIYRWLFYLTVVLSTSYVVLFLEFSFHISRFLDLNQLIILTISGLILFISAYLLVKPNILYGLTGWLHEIREENKVDNPADVNFELALPLVITKKRGIHYKQVLEDHFRENQPFLKTGYKIKELCEETHIPYYLLSVFINQEYGKNFNELVNDYRVNYLHDLLISSPGYRKYTLEALGQIAGFNSRTTFLTAVKKKTGLTPAEYFGKTAFADQLSA